MKMETLLKIALAGQFIMATLYTALAFIAVIAAARYLAKYW